MQVKTPAVRSSRVRPDVVLPAAILAAASVARFSWLDLMEFKGDEANAARLALHVLGYSEPGVGRFFPTAGLVSSIGIPNPPLFVYLVAIPMAIVHSPIAAAAAIAAANVLAVWLTFVAGRRCFGRFVGLASAAMLAVSPWGIVFSRKIWAQDLLPLFTTLFLLQLHGLLVRRRPRSAFWLIVVTAAAVQLHFSACVLVVVAALALVVARRDLAWRWVAAGLVVAILSYVPYLAFHAGSILHSAEHRSPYLGPNLIERFRAASGYTFGIVGGGGMGYLIGKGSTLGRVASDVLGILAPVGLVVAWRRESGRRGRLAMLMLVWYALPLTILTALAIRPYMHYVIILLPLPYLGIAYLIERLFAGRHGLAPISVAAILVCFLIVDVRFFRTVIHDGGAPGDYGIGYRYEREAANYILRQAAGRPVVLGEDVSFAQVRRLTPFKFLLWNTHPGSTSPRGRPAAAFILVDRFRPVPPLLRRDAAARAYPRVEFGPLTVVEVPVG
jgi:Dolichyl-phosphate-mannose-protein mannosyltransferase